MAIDCRDVPANVTYDCANPWGQGCTSDKRFDFSSLWKYTQSIQQACANDSRLFQFHGGSTSPRNASLTQASCAAIAGSDWKYYPGADIWARLTTWKFPLLQLVASFPRPPLSFRVECFVIVHLLGDPIDTVQNLLAKMSSCQNIAKEWMADSDNLMGQPVGEDEDQNWKALALITDAYGEWNESGNARRALRRGLLDNPQLKNELASAIRQTGRALAADRSTKFLPIIVAQAFFIGAVGTAVFRTAAAAGASASSDTVFINVEAHSIGFSAQYFWIIPTIFLGSIVGVSQTEAAIPRILKRFQVDVDRLTLPNETSLIRLPNECLVDDARRVFHGGIYSWQPQKSCATRTFWDWQSILPYFVVILGTATGMAVSALVPPDGWDCRHFGQILIFLAWLLSARIDVWLLRLWPLEKGNQTKLFWFTGVKDLLVTIATMGGVITTQLGVFNRCVCYTLWGKTGLALPEMPDTAETLFHRINTVYPAITFTSISIELIIIPLLISFRYKDALRTFVQRDDRGSNAKWLWNLLKTYQSLITTLQAKLDRRTFSSAHGSRTSTVLIEAGLPDSSEMQPLAQTLSEEPQDISIAEDEKVVNMPMANEQSGSRASISQTSGVDSHSGSGVRVPARPEPRRRNTENRGVTI